MSVLKFRITIEEVDGVAREIELKSDQTFQIFHDAILKFFDLRTKKPAAFFTSNNKWQKVKEIVTREGDGVEGALDGTKESLKKVTQQHKRLIYFNEGTPQLTFLIELKEENEEEKGGKKKYPLCIKSTGNIPSSNIFSSDEELFSGKSNLSLDDLFDEDGDDYDNFY